MNSAGSPLGSGRRASRGQRRRGRQLPGRWEESYCYFVIAHDEKAGLPAVMAEAVGRLREHWGLLEELAATAARFSFFVGWVFDGHAGETFGAQLLHDMGELGVSLELLVYDKKESH
jgi:hypothetical protein